MCRVEAHCAPSASGRGGDARRPAAGVSTVQFVITGGTCHESVIGTAVPTLFGSIFEWNTTSVPGGSYTFQRVHSVGCVRPSCRDENRDTSPGEISFSSDGHLLVDAGFKLDTMGQVTSQQPRERANL
jgi:hypothetical protein